MKHKIFVTAINCMDGRTQLPVIQYLSKNHRADYVDMITEPGPVKLLAENREAEVIGRMQDKVRISVEKHGSKSLAVVAHTDCAGNPVADEIQQKQMRQALKTIQQWDLPLTAIGLWIDSQWQVRTL